MLASCGCIGGAAGRYWRSAAAVASVLVLLASPTWAQTTGDPNAPALRLINTIPINGTAGSPNTKMYSFDISFVDPANGLYYLGDRSNKAVDVVDTTGAFTGTPDTLFGQIGGAAFGFAGDTGNTATSGPNGVAAAFPCIFAGDGPSRVVSINANVSFVAPVSSVNTGGMFRADEMSFDPKDRLLLVANNADTPPFATLLNVSSTCQLTINKKLTYVTANGVNATNGAEQSVWEPMTQRFYQAIPEIGGPGGGGPNGGVARITTSGTVEAVYPVNYCQPAGLTVGPNGDLLVGCSTVFDTSGTACTTAGATAAAFVPPKCTGIAFPQVAVCNPGRGCTDGSLVSVPGVGGGDEIWFNSGDGNYYVTAGNLPLGPTFGVIPSVVNNLTQLVPTMYAQQAVGVAGTSSFVHSAGTVHSIAASAANNHVYVPLPANTNYPNCAQGCIGVFSAQ
jgi:hypothetical protein